MMRPQLILFARAPELGRGKRRLAGEIGDIAALGFERLMLARLMRRLAHDPRWDTRLVLTPDAACHRDRGWRIARIPQGRGELGERMRRAMAAAPCGPVVLIGADIPAVTRVHVAAAFRLLGENDLVFGPAADGGFWLVGARRRPRLPALFARVRWSSPHTLADTLAGLPRGVRVGFAAVLDDVDDAESYRRLNPQRGF